MVLVLCFYRISVCGNMSLSLYVFLIFFSFWFFSSLVSRLCPPILFCLILFYLVLFSFMIMIYVCSIPMRERKDVGLTEECWR